MSQGCANSGPGLTRMEAQVVGILHSEKRNQLMCESIAFTWDAVNYKRSIRCDEQVSDSKSIPLQDTRLTLSVAPWCEGCGVGCTR